MWGSGTGCVGLGVLPRNEGPMDGVRKLERETETEGGYGPLGPYCS